MFHKGQRIRVPLRLKTNQEQFHVAFFPSFVRRVISKPELHSRKYCFSQLEKLVIYWCHGQIILDKEQKQILETISLSLKDYISLGGKYLKEQTSQSSYGLHLHGCIYHYYENWKRDILVIFLAYAIFHEIPKIKKTLWKICIIPKPPSTYCW